MPTTPGWYPDPAGRYEYRFWDGSDWTANVSRSGEQLTDPDGAPPRAEEPPPPPIDKSATPVIQLVEEYLDRFGWRAHQSAPEPGEAEGYVLTGWTSQLGHTYVLSIDPQVEKKAVTFRTVGVVHAPRDATPDERLRELFYALAVINADRIIGAWGYNGRTGELSFHAALPYFGTLEYESFARILDIVRISVGVEAPALRGIVDGTSRAEEVLAREGLA